MASDSTLTGTLSLGMLDGNDPDDPWKRGYLKAPACANYSVETFPLIDVRSTVFQNGLGDTHSESTWPLLRSHGFTAIKHASKLHSVEDFDDVDKLDETYYPEIEKLVKAVTGARHVFITNSIIRTSQKKISTTTQEAFAKQGETKDSAGLANGEKSAAAQEPSKMTNGEAHKTRNEKARTMNPNDSASSTDIERTIHMPTASKVGAANIPHLDYTPLGARQALRRWRLDINKAAKDAGIIAAEDEICAINGTDPTDPSSDSIVAEHYNENGKLGPRYAAFGVWRPLEKVQRDPLAMLPRRHFNATSGPVYSTDGRRLVYWQYDIRVPGNEKLGGDFLRQLVQIKVDPLDSDTETKAAPLPLYYVSDQEPDEVLLVKFFDSAALGPDAVEADGPFHGSPDIGVAGKGGPRKSIECRLVAIW